MKVLPFLLAAALCACPLFAQSHPDPAGPGWSDLFAADLSDAIHDDVVWRFENGLLTATEDREIWTERAFSEFVLDLEFMTASGTNSGVIVHASDIEDWIPNSLEVQIADDYHETWANAPKSWQSGAIFGHLAPSDRAVKEPGEWNRMTITARGRSISVLLNGALVAEMDMDRWTSAETNPDGSEIPSWLSRPVAELPARGHIGLQGKHAGAPIWFRNLRIKKLVWESDIERFEASDRLQPPPPEPVLFVGSSSIRMWTNLAQDFPEIPVLNRGFGGSEIEDAIQYADRIVLPYRPRQIVLYAGDNDISGGKSPEQVLEDFKAFAHIISRDLPETSLLFVAIKPSLARWSLVDKMRAANDLIEAFADDHPSVHFVDVFSPMLNDLGKPRAELFIEDGLHLSEDGYRVWRAVLEPFLN